MNGSGPLSGVSHRDGTGAHSCAFRGVEIGRLVLVQYIVSNSAGEGACSPPRPRIINQNGPSTIINTSIAPAASMQNLPNVKAAVFQFLHGVGLTGVAWDHVMVMFMPPSSSVCELPGATELYQGVKWQWFSVMVLILVSREICLTSLGLINLMMLSYTYEWLITATTVLRGTTILSYQRLTGRCAAADDPSTDSSSSPPGRRQLSRLLRRRSASRSWSERSSTAGTRNARHMAMKCAEKGTVRVGELLRTRPRPEPEGALGPYSSARRLSESMWVTICSRSAEESRKRWLQRVYRVRISETRRAFVAARCTNRCIVPCTGATAW